MTITLKFNMAEDFFGDVLDTARDYCEWAQARYTLRTGEVTALLEARPHWEEGKPFPEGDNRNDWQLIDHAKIEAAIQKILDDDLTDRVTRDTIFDAVCEGDTCHIDADAADAILQIAMFGELVFG